MCKGGIEIYKKKNIDKIRMDMAEYVRQYTVKKKNESDTKNNALSGNKIVSEC